MKAVIAEAVLLKTFAAIQMQRGQPGIIAICGAACLGKSTLAGKWAASLSTEGISCGVLSTDSFMLDSFTLEHNRRMELGLGKYDPAAFDAEAASHAIHCFRQQQPFEYFRWDAETRGPEISATTFEPCSLLFLEGIHSMHTAVHSEQDFSVFLHVADAGPGPTQGEQDETPENRSYLKHIEPFRTEADCLIEVGADWEMLISCEF